MRHTGKHRGKPFRSVRRAGNDKYSEILEPRLLLAAIVASPDPVIYGTSVSGPLARKAGHTFTVAGTDAQGNAISQWADASAITPNTTNDLVMNVSPFDTNYTPCCEAAGGSFNAALLTNGITQNQTAPAPNAGSPAVGDNGASDQSNSSNVVASGRSGPTPYFSYNLGSAGGAAPIANGYDVSEIDVITGHQDANQDVFMIDVQVEPVGSNTFLSLSNGRGFSLTTVPDGAGGTYQIRKGSSQMAIVNAIPGQPLAQNVRAVKLVALDPTTFFREFVVTGTATATPPAGAPATPSIVNAASSGTQPSITWTASAGATGYTVLRGTSAAGPFSQVGSVVGATSFFDTTAQPSTTYFYQVSATGNGDSAASAASGAVATPAFGATASLFQSQLWKGTAAISEILPQVSYRGGQQLNIFPLAAGFNGVSFSTFVSGKIRTDSAGAYTFFANTDDDGYLYVNGQLVSGNEGGHPYRTATTSNPITLAADTSYDFVFLNNNRGNQWGFDMSWIEPGGSTATTVPADHLSPAADAPPAPARPTAAVQTDGSVVLTWTPQGDASSFAYVVERAPADSTGTPTGDFEPVGQAFSGPLTAGAVGAATWGATTFTDTTASPGSTFVYKVGGIVQGQTVPDVLSPASLPVTPLGGSLAPTLSTKFPASVIAGQKINASAVVTITATQATSGNAVTELYLSTGTTVDSDSILLRSVARNVKLKSGGKVAIAFKIPSVPASVPNGTYHVVARVTDPSHLIRSVASDATVTVAPAQIDLAGAFVTTPARGKSGKTVVAFTVSNAGNTAAVGSLAFTINTSPTGQMADATQLIRMSKKINLKPGKSTKIATSVVLPAGSNFLVIQLDPDNVFNDVDMSNNVFVTADPVS